MLGLLLAAAPAPAIADTKVFDDPIGDSTTVDITQVRVTHQDSLTVRVRSATPLTTGQVYSFWVDVDNDRRPDFHFAFQANSDFGSVLGVVHGFGGRRSGSVGCRGMRARADMFSDRPVSLRIPRRCLGDPRGIRVAVKFTDTSTDAVDWAVDRHTFGPWVKR